MVETSGVVYRRTRTITGTDVDHLGHVNNLVWVHFAIDLADAHSRAVGLGFEAYRDAGGVWVVRRHEIDYLRSAAEGDAVVEETWVAEMRGARSERHSRFTLADGTELVKSQAQWVFVDPRSMRPKRIPPEVLERFVVGSP